MSEPYVGPAPYAPAGAGLEAAITALEIELRAVRADLAAVLCLIPDLSAAERARIEQAPMGMWRQTIASIPEPTVLWDRDGDEWRLATIKGVTGWVISDWDNNPWPLEMVGSRFGPITFKRPESIRYSWDA